MATWQFNISFIERGSHSPRRTDDGHDIPALTAERTKQASVWLNQVFGSPREMLDGWYVFGQEDGNRFDLILNPDKSSELSARIDLRSDPSAFLERICELGNSVNCALFSAELWTHIEPVPSDIVQAAQVSSAAAYVQNPVGFLSEIAGGA